MKNMVNFKPSEKGKNMEYSVCYERGTKNELNSLTGIEPMTFRTSVGCSKHAARLPRVSQ